ncbi:CapA family protein [Syntrophotalea acetylenica]|uniref:CapA family protein n=1 Tax=Syntrophotalea acetylenica TaxID=29542 RepID=UPI002A359144|nr:CapA family protein [Syntrophotalea acetylenica]MDY0263346.1 CapA family protein [Syntrophotalea acetylenica]
MKPETSLRLAVVGDLLFTTPYGSKQSERGLEALAPEIRALFSRCDLVLANLESTLPAEHLIESEPRVLGSPAQFDSLKAAHINLVSLANNHAFDALTAGFTHTKNKLAQLQIRSFGAGVNQKQAQESVSLDINGIRIAFIGAVAPSTGMQHFAAPHTPGVAYLDTEAICANIQHLKQDHHHVILSPHWGDERYRFPSPEQIAQGHAFIDAGATAVLGHHPHVIQGVENYHNGFIAYSLGNFLSNRVFWENGDMLTWDRFERSSQIVMLELNKKGIAHVEQIPVFDNGTTVEVERRGRTDKYLKRADSFIQSGITATTYAKESFRVKKILPFKAQLRWSKVRQIRLSHLKKGLKLLLERH